MGYLQHTCEKHGELEEINIGINHRKGTNNFQYYCKICRAEGYLASIKKIRDARIKCKNDECSNYAKFSHSHLCGPCQYRWDKYKTLKKAEPNKLPEGILKKCKIHGFLVLEDVYIDDGLYRCIQCRREQRRKKTDPEKVRERNLMNNFKIDLNDYNLLLLKQNNVCAICNKPETMKQTHAKDKLRNLAVDHCHDTGRIRGLLCGRCNNMIGYSKDNPATLRAGADYLEI